MKKSIDWLKSISIFFPPFLIALYSIVFLFANNIKQYQLPVIIIPLCIVFIYTLFILFITTFFLKKTLSAVIISSYILFMSVSFERVVNLISTNILIGKFEITEEMLVGSLFVIFLGMFIFLLRKIPDGILRRIPTALNLLFGLLVLFSLFRIIPYELKNGRVFRQKTFSTTQLKTSHVLSGQKPDIYYFIFDRYAGQKSLKEQYGYDNSDFLNFLKEKGFFVPKNSTTNYPKTFLSLGSSLNMKYLDELTEKTNGGLSSDESLVTPLIRNNNVLAFLKQQGYSYINVGSWWEPTSFNEQADLNFKGGSVGYPFADEFTTGYLNTTFATPVLKSLFHDPNDISFVPQDNIHRKAILYEFSVFNKIPQIPGPKFVFAHILIPHDPFVFDKECNPVSEKLVQKKQHQENYLGQMQCANKKIKVLLTTILSKNKTKPVIIFQADEGPFPMNSPLPPDQAWGTATTQSLNEKFPIFNAYYFPGVEDTHLYDTITPVNSFRILLNNYFHTDYPLLPDKNYVFQDENNYYKFIDVTNKVK